MEPSSDDLVWTQSSVMDYRMIPQCRKLFKVLCGCFVAMHWRYKVDNWTLTGHFSFSLGLRPLCNSPAPFVVEFPAIRLLAASTLRKFGFCVEKVLGMFHLFSVCSTILPSLDLFLVDTLIPPFSVPWGWLSLQQ